ncbi:hypothetical protein J1N35_014417 [Gossypium stocksii]|uniref:Serine hydroxymethyltransferase-like domain-containing protein n=1 Tax=Gossypium stocksii TaxID=47602 RepID=A0A9D3VW10_9ROSI|nr:hypothetical protein J1N35_014417 [Gossypium stocksii]
MVEFVETGGSKSIRVRGRCDNHHSQELKGSTGGHNIQSERTKATKEERSSRRCIPIGCLAVALKQAMSPGFKAYAKQVKANAAALGNYLISKGYRLLTGGTDNHLLLWDLRPLVFTDFEKVCEACNVTVNRNPVFGDSSAVSPGGVRIGSPAITSRGLVEKDFEGIGELLDRAVRITFNIQKQYGKLLKDFNKGLEHNKEIEELKDDVEKFASSFDMPG